MVGAGSHPYICDMLKASEKSGAKRAAEGPAKQDKTLLIACGALAREIVALQRAHQWKTLDVTCLPAICHNRPEKIPEGVRTVPGLRADAGVGADCNAIRIPLSLRPEA